LFLTKPKRGKKKWKVLNLKPINLLL
jgi:hypothetical protein